MKVESFASNLKRLRLELGLTQKVLGKRLGTSQATYQKWETGKMSPTLRILSRIVNVLGIPLEELFKDND